VGEGRYFKKREREGENKERLAGIWFVRKLTFSHFYLFIFKFYFIFKLYNIVLVLILLILSSTQTISIFSHFCPPTFVVV